jgi:hypothetical protein
VSVDSIFPRLRFSPGVPPGVYEIPQARPVAEGDVRMDVTAFVGLTERGSTTEAVAVESWEDFLYLYGAPGGGRLLPEAVHQFFVNGGRRCVVLRRLPHDALRSQWALPGIVTASGAPLVIEARDAGRWGERLVLEVVVRTRDLALLEPARGLEMKVPLSIEPPPPHALIRRIPADPLAHRHELAYAASVEPGADHTVVRLANGQGWDARQAEEVTVDITVGLDSIRESWEDLGLHPGHPRYLLRALRGSLLVRPGRDEPALGPRDELLHGDRFARSAAADRDEALRGDDRAGSVERSLFVGDALGALRDHDDRHAGMRISLLAFPDLVHTDSRQASAPAGDPPAPIWPRFASCGPKGPPPPAAEPGGYPRLRLTSKNALREVWQEIVGFCEAHTDWVAVLDLPPELVADDVAQLRRSIASERAALYAPYLRVAPAGERGGPPVTIPPCGTVCGIFARAERERGVWAAPSNIVVRGVERVVDASLPADFLHRERVNAVRETERGLTLLGSRTTSFDPAWTHVSVRRLVDQLRRQIEIDARWAVFEPITPDLSTRLRLSVEDRLRKLFAAGALRGGAAEEAFFVAVDDGEPRDGAGRVTMSIGIAPSVPAELIVFQLTLLPGGGVELGGEGG